MIGIGSDSSVALTAHQSAHGWKPLFALCLFCGMLMGMLSAPAWSADAQGVVQKKLSTSPERLFVQ